MKKLTWALMALFLFVLLAGVPALAQDGAPEATIEATAGLPPDGGADEGPLPEVDPVDTATEEVEQAADNLYMLINLASGLLIAAIQSPFTLLVVSIIKRFLPNLKAGKITLAIGGVLAILGWVSGALGFQVQFNDVIKLLTDMIPLVLSFIGTLTGAPILFNIAAKNGAPIVGYSRTPENNPALVGVAQVQAISVDDPSYRR